MGTLPKTASPKRNSDSEKTRNPKKNSGILKRNYDPGLHRASIKEHQLQGNRDRVSSSHYPTSLRFADIGTKVLPVATFVLLRDVILGKTTFSSCRHYSRTSSICPHVIVRTDLHVIRHIWPP